MRQFGSSPQAWGTCNGVPARQPFDRFIPTGVGNMGIMRDHRSQIAVHPHRRGEHKKECNGGINNGGSSPQAWGTLHLLGVLLMLIRFIPTGVGNMDKIDDLTAKITVHPHRRGEHARWGI